MRQKQFGPTGAFYGEPTGTPLMSGTVTTSGSGTARDSGESTVARLTLAVSAASGTTPSLTVTVETSGDGITWQSLGSFAAKTGVSSERKTFAGLDNFVRCSWTVSGTTPSFTASVAGVLV